MSKIGRKPIDCGPVVIEINGKSVNYKGKKGSGSHELPACLKAEMLEKKIKLSCEKNSRHNKMLWGLHRALLANEIKGAEEGFKQEINITGLGFKVAIAGKNATFSLGYSHKINFTLPEGITLTADKTGQILAVEGNNKEQVGLVASKIRSLRPPEPYKGTGIKLAGEIIVRKAGKTKAS